MILIGLTGGIGSGKSEVARLLTNRGAVLIDADQIVRELQRPGAEVYLKMVELFGPEVVASDKSLDRAAIATRVFSDSNLLKTLNELIHPIVRRVMNERIESFRETDKVVVLDIPLLVENPREGLDGVLVVDLDVDLALGRLVEQRNMSVEDANARIAKQATREQRLAIADHVIDNSGDRTQLEEKVETAWSWIQSLK
ncbi:MAG: dephospho-CoA kinase [Actinobacteria bacterium]|jgi:dephospho-CoA kinase|nr:dephospho-CoA kinase [Actinomycetota bacterium]NBY61578.1 dephospho-CoA kinase [Actinomycetota bacterium]NDB41824.1 dephospho-CoA kinase [Actinomycetota bacterium]NDF87529.1 dephospho-CoA kinase [Actinomycetota bacterium]HBQ52208.1 dephospho-CoA kinase [Acidimicrobium sp.]